MVGPMLGPMLAYLGPMLALSWPHVGPSWPYVGPRLAYVGPMLAHVGPMLAHLEAYVGASLGVFLAIYVATPSRCQLVRFFALPGAQNHVKTTVFAHRQDKIRGRRGPRNTVKNDVFERHAQNTPQITRASVVRGLTRGCSGVVPGASAAGASAHITFGYQPKAFRQGHGLAAGPAPGFKGLRLTAGRRPKKGRRKYVEPRSVCG